MDFKSDQHFQRDFGFTKILWKIENFWLLLRNKNWEICSPEFSIWAHHLTSWKLILKPTSRENLRDDCFLSLYLERLDFDLGPIVVRANWKLKVLNCKRKEKLFTEIEYLFKKSHRHGENIEIMSCLLSDFEPFEIDDLHIQCQLIVNCETDHIKLFRCCDTGIRSLSDDLHILYRNSHDPDIILRIKHKEIPVNKAILYARNTTMASILNRNPEIKMIDLCNISNTRLPDSVETGLFSSSFFNTEAVERIIDYIYSGRLEDVISKPSVSLYECAILFDIGEVIAYYHPDELILNNAVNVEENVFFWLITDFKLRKDSCILSPPLTKGLMKSIWRLRLFPKGIDNNENYVSLHAEINGGELVQEACVEFAVMDTENNFYNFKRLQKTFGLGEILSFDDFIKRDCLENAPFLSDGTLRIVFKLRTFMGESILSNECDSVISIMSPQKETSLLMLSEDLADLFGKGKFSDITIQCDNDHFKVHTCIMVARSDNFQKIMMDNSIGENTIFIQTIKSNVLRILLYYIYSGVLEDFDPDVTYEIHSAATYFGVCPLIDTCSKMLIDNQMRFADSGAVG